MLVPARWTTLLCAHALVSCVATSPASAAQEQVESEASSPPSFWLASSGIVALNALPWAYNWYVMRWPWANVGSRAWEQNLRSGFEWDDNSFLTNQLSHPLHGSLYLNAARMSGYGFWGALPFVAAGSLSWEFFMENVTPSINDVVNTTLGGMALGEVTFRLGSLLGSSAGADVNSRMRKVGVGGLRPGVGSIAVGRQAGRYYVLLGYEYGSPFDARATKPYDAFESSAQIGSEDGRLIRHMAIAGLLARRELRRSERNVIVLGVYQHYDYDDLPRIAFGGQSLSGALLIQKSLGSEAQLQLGTHAEAVLLGAISSEEGHFLRRDYDYTSGAGVRLSSAVRFRGDYLLRFNGRIQWLHSLYGAPADHMLTHMRLATAWRLGRIVAIGGDVGGTFRHSHYRDRNSVRVGISETRVYLMWP